MDTARPLRDVFADLSPADLDGAGTADSVLSANGHPDLPGGLVAEAVGSYADTAPLEVAEHLSPYVMAHSSVPLPDLPEVAEGQWLNLVASAPEVADLDLGADPTDGLDDAPAMHHAADPGFDGLDFQDVAYGHGVGSHEVPDLSDVDTTAAHTGSAPADHFTEATEPAHQHLVTDHVEDLVDPGLDDADDDGPDDLDL